MAENDRMNHDTLASLAIYFPVLVALAKCKKTIFYSELQEEAEARNENYPRVAYQRVGRTLEWFRCFTDQRNLPDISALVVKKATGKVGEGYHRNPTEQQQACFDCSDWHETEIEKFLREMEKFIGWTRKEIRKYFLD